MPNWCANSLKLIAKTADADKKMVEIIQELARAKTAGDDASIFAIIKPIPEALHITSGWLGKDTPEQKALELAQQENLKTYGYKDWYDFCVNEWGTKWDARTSDYDMPYDIVGNEVTIFFDTAWSPPMQIYYALEEMGFLVEATYIEQGMGYIGYYTDGVDTCERMDQFEPEVDEEDDDYFGILCDKIDKYFESKGFDHSPANMGG